METTAAPLAMPAAPTGVDAARRRRQLIGVAILLVAACVLPFLVGNYRVFQLTLVLAYSIALLGLNMLTGYNGQISLGHGAFYAIGAYTVGILVEHGGVPYWLCVPAGSAPAWKSFCTSFWLPVSSLNCCTPVCCCCCCCCSPSSARASSG